MDDSQKATEVTMIALVFVVAVSGAGYWGISTVEQSTAEVAATSSAIRNHIEAGMYNDLTRADMSAVFTARGDEQQNRVENLTQHLKLLQDRIAKAEQFAVDPTSRKMLSDESQVLDQYLTAGAALAEAILHDPNAASAQLGPYLQLYKDLQGKIEGTSDQLEKGAKESKGRRREGSRGGHPHHVYYLRSLAFSYCSWERRASFSASRVRWMRFPRSLNPWRKRMILRSGWTKSARMRLENWAKT